MNKLPLAICLGLLLAVSVVCTAKETEDSLSNGIIRLHVRANSNSKEDQELKLKVRDTLLAEGEILKSQGKSVDSARDALRDNLKSIERIAREEIVKNGYNYPVRVSLGKSDFPKREYGDMILPAGTYTALTVEIGEGKGDNWWCVMFPPLCFADESYITPDHENREILIDSLGRDTYEMVTDKKITVKFKLYEVIKKFI